MRSSAPCTCTVACQCVYDVRKFRVPNCLFEAPGVRLFWVPLCALRFVNLFVHGQQRNEILLHFARQQQYAGLLLSVCPKASAEGAECTARDTGDDRRDDLHQNSHDPRFPC